MPIPGRFTSSVARPYLPRRFPLPRQDQDWSPMMAASKVARLSRTWNALEGAMALHIIAEQLRGRTGDAAVRDLLEKADLERNQQDVNDLLDELEGRAAEMQRSDNRAIQDAGRLIAEKAGEVRRTIGSVRQLYQQVAAAWRSGAGNRQELLDNYLAECGRVESTWRAMFGDLRPFFPSD